MLAKESVQDSFLVSVINKNKTHIYYPNKTSISTSKPIIAL